MKPTKAQMKLIEEVSRDVDGNFYYLVPGWKRERFDEVHYLLEAVHDDDYDPKTENIREQMKHIVKCECIECLELIAKGKKGWSRGMAEGSQ